jgi:hypothetical protein
MCAKSVVLTLVTPLTSWIKAGHPSLGNNMNLIPFHYTFAQGLKSVVKKIVNEKCFSFQLNANNSFTFKTTFATGK